MHIAICDDEQVCVDAIYQEVLAYAKKNQHNFNITTFLSAAKLLAESNQVKFDLIILDISMPEINGLDLARQIRLVDTDVQIVFITNMADEMPNGYDVMAAGFMIKPITPRTLYEVLYRIIAQYERKQISPYEIKLKGGKSGIFIPQDVLYLESRAHNIRAVLKTGEYEYWGKLSQELSKLSASGFAQIHRSYLVNMAWVWLVSDDSVTFTNNISLKIGAKYSENFKEAYRKYRKGGLG